MKTSEVVDQIFKTAKRFISVKQDSDTSTVNIFLIKKRIGQRNELEKFTTHRLRIADNVAKPMRESLQSTLNSLIETNPKIKRFSDPSVLSDDLMIINKKSLKTLEGLLSDLELHHDGASIESLKQMEHAKAYCFEVKVNNESIYVFAEVANLYFSKQGGKISAQLKDGELKIMDSEIIVFSKDIVCTYFPKLEHLLIMDYEKTAQLLGFREQYRETATKVLKDLSNTIDIDDEFLENKLTNHEVNKVIVQMDIEKRIIQEPNHYKDYNSFCDAHSDLEELEKLMFDGDDRVKIKDMQGLEIFLHVSDNRIVEGVVKRGEFSIAIRRTLLRKKSETKR